MLPNTRKKQICSDTSVRGVGSVRSECRTCIKKFLIINKTENLILTVERSYDERREIKKNELKYNYPIFLFGRKSVFNMS